MAASNFTSQFTGSGRLGDTNHDIGGQVSTTSLSTGDLGRIWSIGTASFTEVWNTASSPAAIPALVAIVNQDTTNFVHVAVVIAGGHYTERIPPLKEKVLFSSQVNINSASATPGVSATAIVSIHLRADTAACICKVSVGAA